jgi:hypothetical protein
MCEQCENRPTTANMSNQYIPYSNDKRAEIIRQINFLETNQGIMELNDKNQEKAKILRTILEYNLF